MRIPHQTREFSQLSSHPGDVRAIVASQRRNLNAAFSLRQRGNQNAIYAPQTPHGPFLLQQHDCPAGTYPKVVHYPVYDEEGLFVVGWRASVYCMSIDYEPVG